MVMTWQHSSSDNAEIQIFPLCLWSLGLLYILGCSYLFFEEALTVVVHHTHIFSCLQCELKVFLFVGNALFVYFSTIFFLKEPTHLLQLHYLKTKQASKHPKPPHKLQKADQKLVHSTCTYDLISLAFSFPDVTVLWYSHYPDGLRRQQLLGGKCCLILHILGLWKEKLVSKVSEYWNIHLGTEALNLLTVHLTRCGLIFTESNQTPNEIIQNKAQEWQPQDCYSHHNEFDFEHTVRV